jgi:transposase
MDRYIGIDVHRETCTFAVTDRRGKLLLCQTLETHGEAIRQWLSGIPGDKHICIEEVEMSEWIYALLWPVAKRLVVVQARKREFGDKSDRLDAQKLADRIRLGDVKNPVYKAPNVHVALRHAVKAYEVATQDQVRARVRLKAFYTGQGLMKAGGEVYSPTERPAWEAKVCAEARLRAELLGCEFDSQLVRAKKTEQWLKSEASKVPAVKLLTTIPGIGVIRAAQIVAVVITPHRFRGVRQFWAYCGLGIVNRTSADYKVKDGQVVEHRRVQTRGLNRNRNAMLKNVFRGAAITIERKLPEHPLHQKLEELVSNGTPINLARLTLARKIAAKALVMWKREEEYDPSKDRRG